MSYLVMYNFKMIHENPIYNIILIVTWVSILFLVISTMLICMKSEWKGKWGWLIFTLIGITKININWMTGEIKYGLHFFSIPPFKITYSFIDKDLNTIISFPVGALLLLIIFSLNRTGKGRSDSLTENVKE